jgi:hypothetical protein
MLYWNFTFDGSDRPYRGYGETLEQATNDVREMLEEGLHPDDVVDLKVVGGPHDLALKTDFGPNGPHPGTVAYTAFMMAQLCPPEEIGQPDDFWDDWKEDMKERL